MGKRRGGPDHKLSIDKEEATQKNTVKGQPRRRQSGRCKESKLSNQQQSEGAEADGTCPVPSMSYLIRHDSGRWRPDTTRKRRVRDFIDHIVQPQRNTELKCKIQILFFFHFKWRPGLVSQVQSQRAGRLLLLPIEQAAKKGKVLEINKKGVGRTKGSNENVMHQFT